MNRPVGLLPFREALLVHTWIYSDIKEPDHHLIQVLPAPPDVCIGVTNVWVVHRIVEVSCPSQLGSSWKHSGYLQHIVQPPVEPEWLHLKHSFWTTVRPND